MVDFVDVDKSPTVRFSIQQTQGREIDNAGDVRAIASWTITMRFRPGVLAGMRIKAVEPTAPAGGFRYYKITAVNDVNQLHHELELTAVESLSPRP